MRFVLGPAEIVLPQSATRYVRRSQRIHTTLARGWDQFTEHRFGVFGLGIIVVLILVALFPSVFTLHSPSWNVGYLGDPPSGPAFGPLTGDSYVAPLGTDTLGRDIYSQLVRGTPRSLGIALASGTVATLIGVPAGILSGYYENIWIDEGLQRAIDLVLSVPFYAGLLFLLWNFGYTVQLVIFAVAFTAWANHAAKIRGKVLSLKENAYIDAVRASGGSDEYIMVRHLLPQVAPLACLNFGRSAALGLIAHFDLLVILAYADKISEAPLIYSTPTDPFVDAWGQVFALAIWEQAADITYVPWMIFPPGLLVVLTAASLYFISYSLEDVTSPNPGVDRTTSTAVPTAGAETDTTEPAGALEPTPNSRKLTITIGIPRPLTAGVQKIRTGGTTIRDRTDRSGVDFTFLVVVLLATLLGTGYILQTTTAIQTAEAEGAVATDLQGAVTDVTLADDRLTVAITVENPTSYRVRPAGGFLIAANASDPKLVYAPAERIDPTTVRAHSTRTVRYTVTRSSAEVQRMRAALRNGSVSLIVRSGFRARIQIGPMITNRSEPISRSFAARLTGSPQTIRVQSVNSST